MSIYNFVNVTKNVDDCISETNILDTSIISLFNTVIVDNKWNNKDTIMAFPEKKSNPIFRYKNGDIKLKMDIDDEIEVEKENCNYCNEVLDNHLYGNICAKHIPSYALWDNESNGNNYEETELSRYDYGQDDYDYENDNCDNYQQEDDYDYRCDYNLYEDEYADECY